MIATRLNITVRAIEGNSVVGGAERSFFVNVALALSC